MKTWPERGEVRKAGVPFMHIPGSTGCAPVPAARRLVCTGQQLPPPHLHVEVLPQLGVVQHQDALNNHNVSRLHLANLFCECACMKCQHQRRLQRPRASWQGDTGHDACNCKRVCSQSVQH